MQRFFFFLTVAVVFAAAGFARAGITPKTVVTELKNPESVVVTADGRIFVTTMGDFDKDGDGAVYEIKDGKPVLFVDKLFDPKGIIAFQSWLFVADMTKVYRIDQKTGKSEVYADGKDFPIPPQVLNDITVDEFGNLYVSDSADGKSGGAIFKIASKFSPKGKIKEEKPTPPKVTVVAEAKKHPFIKAPNGLLMDSLYHLLVLDFASGELNRLRLSDGLVEKVADGFIGGDSLCWDRHGRLYISSWSQGKVWSIPRPGEKPILLVEGMKSSADMYLDTRDNLNILIPDMLSGTLVTIPAQPTGWEVDVTPLKLETEVAFGDLKWTGWDSGEDTGKVNPLRPILLTHANDQSGRTFVATQHGVIHSFKEGDKATNVFLDLQNKVMYNDKENEQGLLGVAFHPKYKEKGEVFLFYTLKEPKLTNVVSRFKVSKSDPNKLDPTSEEELLRINHKYWNHDGGTLAFGPDGYLYIVLGDGGSGNDPDDHGQKMDTLLGKILRIDIDHKGDNKPYAIPKDNPFVGKQGALPEIYVLGLRNPWRLSFDRKTGQGWIAEVGQNLWEEINLLEKGANYGWRRRESLHPFWAEGTGPKPEYVEPIWEYHHEIGKSITGGHVYRGKALPELEGLYLYADYVTGRLWALKYDETKKRVVANHPIKDKALPIMSYGEDEKGEVYLMTYSATGKGIYRFVKSK
jgi:glucose/arabinose dehydrogenase